LHRILPLAQASIDPVSSFLKNDIWNEILQRPSENVIHNTSPCLADEALFKYNCQMAVMYILIFNSRRTGYKFNNTEVGNTLVFLIFH
jgi:hypothetical protein